MIELILFGAKWCKACKEMHPVAKEAAEEAKVGFIYADAEENPEMMQKYRVRHAPTIIAKNGENIAVLIDYQPKEKVIELIHSVR